MIKPQRKLNRARVLTPKAFAAVLFGSLAAVFAFSQAAASVGLPIASFRPLGAGFFAIRAVQAEAVRKSIEPGQPTDVGAIAKLGRQGLVYAPLNPRALWLVGQSWDKQGQTARARTAMRTAERVSRREAAVQIWLGLDNLKNDRIPQGLRNFDLLIRTNAEAAKVFTPALAKVIVSPEGRREMGPYFNASNPWLADLMWAAVHDLPRVAPLAQLLISQKGMAPNREGLGPIYADLVKRLLDQKEYSLALQLYSRLPGANPAAVQSLSPSLGGKIQENYPPFVWGFAEGDSQGGSLIALPQGGVGLELFGSPGTIGVAASKLLIPGAHTDFQWQTIERSANSEGSASWEVTCLLGAAQGAKITSVDLLSAAAPANRKMAMPIPKNCQLIRIDMRVAGGVGRDPVRLVIGDFALGTSGS